MIITLIIYLLIIGYIILKAFYTSIFIKYSNNNQEIEKFSDSINSISMPFYINMSQIYLLCIFINLIFLIFISLTLMPDLMNDLLFSISNSNIVYCQDYISDEESSSDDGWGWDMPITRNSFEDSSDDEERNQAWSQLQNLNLTTTITPSLNIEEDIYKVHDTHPYLTAHFFPGYDYYGIFKELIEETYKISDINRFFIYHLNADNIDIQNHLKVFQGLSQNFEDIFNKQNVLLQKISYINEHSYTLDEVKKMYNEINKRSIDTLILTCTAYDQMMSSYYNNPIYYSDKELFELLFKIFDNKNDQNINLIIKNFTINGQVDILNEKATNSFKALEEVQIMSKENYNILNERKEEALRIDSNTPITRIINISKENKIKNYNELYSYSTDKKALVFNDPMRYDNIESNIHDFHKEYYRKNYIIQSLLEKGFVLKENNNLLHKSYNNYDNDY